RRGCNVVDQLVQERRVERVRERVLRRPVLRVYLEPTGEVGRLAEELRFEPVAKPADALRDEQPWRNRIGEEPRTLPRSPDDEVPGEDAEQDGAPDAEAALPDREEAPPLVRHLVPAGDVVVGAGADDPERDAPDRHAQ